MNKNNEIKTKNQKEGTTIIPKSNEQLLKDFRSALEKRVKTKTDNYIEDMNFYVILNGTQTPWNYIDKIHTSEIKEYVRDIIEYEIKENIDKKKKDIIVGMVNERYEEIINCKTRCCVDYIIAKAEEYIEELEIEKILLEEKEYILQEIRRYPCAKWVEENYSEFVKIVQDLLRKYPVKISRTEYTSWFDYERKDLWAEECIEKLLDILPFFLKLEYLELLDDLEYADGIDEICEELEKIADDIKNGKIKDIKTFDLDMYM